MHQRHAGHSALARVIARRPASFIPLRCAAPRLEMREEEEVALMPLISHPHFELRDGREEEEFKRNARAWAEVISGNQWIEGDRRMA